MKRRRGILGIISALAVLLGSLVLAAGPAHAVVLNCGDFLDSSSSNQTLVLDADIGPCPNSTRQGLFIFEASNMTLDLNGHSIIGSGLINTPNANENGIYVFGNNITIKNGTVRNWNNGIYVDGTEGGGGNTITNMTLQDNIGPDSTGSYGDGIQIFQGSGNTVTGNQVIHNGPFAGIAVYQSTNNTVSGNTVQNNNILNTSTKRGRTDPNGGPPPSGDAVPTQMQDIGIWVTNVLTNPALATGNSVTGNTVTGSGFDGIQVGRFTDDATVSDNTVTNNGSAQPGGSGIPHDGAGVANFGNAVDILSNSIDNNAGLGIDLAGNGVTPNDTLDPDPGSPTPALALTSNLLQNYPVLTSAGSSVTNTTISGTLNSYASTNFTLEFFSSPACDPSGFGEGQTFLGSQAVSTDGSGNTSFSTTVPVGLLPGQQVTSTATGPNGTSEFSACVASSAAPDADEIAVFRPASGTWFVRGGPTVAWGTTGDIPVEADYNGDGTDEIAVFRPSNGTWYVQSGPTTAWGTSGDIPVPADYDGDGDDDIAVFRPSNGSWYVLGGPIGAFGTSGDIPVPADYDGDGDDDIAVFRPSTGTWFVNGGPTADFGTTGDIPVPGNYDGDGDDEFAVFRASFGSWFVNGGPSTVFGVGSDIPVPSDYNGDGSDDIAVFRPSDGNWYLQGGPTVPWGSSGDTPVPADYVG